MSGFFVTLEGPEGAGKSSQARQLAAALADQGWATRLTREPGGTPLGERIRALLFGPEECAILAEAEALLYSAARAQHVREVLRPALAAGQVVVCDRYADSTLAYQGGGQGLDPAALRAVQEFATGGLMPDLTVLLDLPVEIGLARRLGGAGEVNRLDRAAVTFHARVRAAYQALAAADPDRWVVVDAARPFDVVAAEVVSRVVGRVRLVERAG